MFNMQDWELFIACSNIRFILITTYQHSCGFMKRKLRIILYHQIIVFLVVHWLPPQNLNILFLLIPFLLQSNETFFRQYLNLAVKDLVLSLMAKGPM